MKNPKDMTQQEIDDLPIWSPIEYELITAPDDRFPDAKIGDTINIPRARKVNCQAYSTDDIIFFLGSNGVQYAPVFDDGKWHKKIWG